jgi:hypothetical protein
VYDTPHMAANIGLADRYTLQITGHLWYQVSTSGLHLKRLL